MVIVIHLDDPSFYGSGNSVVRYLMEGTHFCLRNPTGTISLHALFGFFTGLAGPVEPDKIY